MSAEVNKNLLASLIDAETLYQDAPCGYLSFLPDGTIIKINQTLLNWLGYNSLEVLYQKKFSNLLSKGGSMHYEMFFRPMISMNGAVKELSYELFKQDGSPLPTLISAATLKDTSGTVVAINAVVYNITYRKIYEKELLLAKKTAESEKKTFQFLADLIPEMIWTANAEGHIDYVNQRFIQYFNLNSNNFHRGVILKIKTEDRKKFLKIWLASIKTSENLNVEVRLQNVLNQYEWHLIKAVSYRGENGTIQKWFGSCTNINSHILALQQKDEFINIAGHELKTPITSLKAGLQLMERMKDKPSAKMLESLIAKANKNINKIGSLIDDLLNASQINSGQLHLNKSYFLLHNLIGDACQHILYESNLEVIINGNALLKVFADEGRIEQVVVNFINNAVKYAPNSKQIIITSEKSGQTVKVSVTDKGPGIPAEKLPLLFDRYYRVEGTGSKYSGLGLGLYICAEIIKKHNGEIGVNSEVGKGSTFWFTLPIE